jgi:hypothetical protein
VFTGTLVAHLEKRELISFDDPIAEAGKLVDPKLANFPDEITWGNVADHTSGMLSLYSALLFSAEHSCSTHYCWSLESAVKQLPSDLTDRISGICMNTEI